MGREKGISFAHPSLASNLVETALSPQTLALMMMMMWSLMSSDVGLTYKGQTVTNACAWFNVALRPQKPQGSLGRGAQDGHLDFHTAPEL